ncbi:MAG: UDP-4-amino-4,6-dideoxy-N-acetyl-beta-L-altrosamine transaminase [Hahellaceae bacterium]|nr:UDP-4-amino-4,6-dideoxy-N-acetyl-beta-L-altrosamine transaminase [Hahellaceae bacterium]
MIPYGRQSVSEQDIAQVVEVLRSDFLTQGPVVSAFEQAVAQYCGSGHAVAVNSGTSALHIACLALGLGEGDWLWTSPISFVASSNCALYCGAQVDFVDIDVATGNMDIDLLAEKLEKAASEGRLPKIIVPVHFAGQPCDMDRLDQLRQRWGFRVIEDACHASGAAFQNTPVGRGQYSDVTVFSFHPVKITTSGEGGMAICNDASLATKMRQLASHGITRDSSLFQSRDQGAWFYEQQHLGFNYRMSDIHAALGLSQWARVDEFVANRNRLACIYDQAFANSPVCPLVQRAGRKNSYHLYVIKLRETCSQSRKAVFEKLRLAGIGVNVHYIPIHMQPYYQRLGFETMHFLNAESFYQQAITLPLYATLSDDQQQQVIEQVLKIVCPA